MRGRICYLANRQTNSTTAAAAAADREQRDDVVADKRTTDADERTCDDAAARSRELAGERKRSWWLRAFTASETLAADYVEAHARNVADIVTRSVIVAAPDTPLRDISLPVLPALQATLDFGPIGELAFICGANGKPLTKESFGNMFSEAARAAGVNKSAHGVRKIGATRAAENGATVAELEAIFGWEGGRMASLYTRAADRVRLARGAMHKMAGTPNEQSMPAPHEKVRASAIKRQ